MSPWRRNLWVVAAANFVTMVGMSAFLPFFPDILRDMGIRSLGLLKIWSGLLTAAAPLAAAFMGPIWGALGDRHGRKPMVTRSLAAIAVFVGLMGVVTLPAVIHHLGGGWWRTPWPLLILRVGQGVFSGFIAPALTLVTVGAPKERQNRVTAFSQSAVVAGTVVGPAVGAWVAGHGGAHLAFLWCAGMAALATALVAFAASEVRAGEALLVVPDRRSLFATLRQAFGDAKGNLAMGGLGALMVGLFLIQAANTMVQPILRLHVEHFPYVPVKRLPAVAACAFSAAAVGQILFAPLWSRLGERKGAGSVIPLTTMLTACALLPMGFVSKAFPFWGLRFVQGAVMAGTVPAAYVHVGRVSSQERRGGAYGLALSAFQLANVAGPILGGYLSAAFGTPPLFLVSAGFLAAASLWMRRIL